MSHELLEFITPLTSPELAETLSDLDNLLSHHQFTGHEDELEQLYNSAESRDRETLIDDVCVIMRTAAYRTLRGMGVELIEDAQFSIVYKVIEVLLGFEGADDYEHLLAILDYDLAPDEILCEILDARSDLPVEEYMVLLSAVNPELIQRMRNVLRAYELSQDRATETKEILDRLNLFHTENPNVLSQEALIHGIRPGVSMEDLYSVFEDDLIARPVETAVKDLIGMSIMAGVSAESLNDELRYFIEDLYPTLEDRMGASKVLERELAQYQRLMDSVNTTC